MNTLLKILGPVALLLTVVPPTLFMMHHLAEGTMKMLMLVGCLMWFATAPKLMKGGSQ